MPRGEQALPEAVQALHKQDVRAMTDYQARCTAAGIMLTIYFIETGFIIRFLIEGKYG